MDDDGEMKYAVTRFKSLSIALKELEPFIKIGQHLLTGPRFTRFDGLRSREILGNWLSCVAINSITEPDRLTFSSDPNGGDGIIMDTHTGETWPTEHVMVPAIRPGQEAGIQSLILKAVTAKQNKGGAAYAAGKTLVIFLNAGGGEWFPNRVAKVLPMPLLFDAVWVWGFQSKENGNYAYNITRLDLTNGNAPVWRVHIREDFEAWAVEVLQ
jgi:hypothetical protein